MILGKAEHFQKAHFEANKGVAPAYLCELVVHCLELVAQLSRSGLRYRFKGGNSQLILLQDPQRFSIDVDIVTDVDKADLIELVERLTAECDLFSRCEVRQHKTKPWLPMVSFKLWFSSHYQSAEDAFVMLDAVLEPAPYPGVRMPIVCAGLYAAPEIDVELPSLSGLIADKLLCIGPSTLGIPLGKGKEAQRLKHVFDVATLSKEPHDKDAVLAALKACMAQENAIQKSSWDFAQVAADTRVFCTATAGMSEPPDHASLPPGSYLDEIVRGYVGFKDFLFRIDYTWTRFQEDFEQVLRVLDALERSA